MEAQRKFPALCSIVWMTKAKNEQTCQHKLIEGQIRNMKGAVEVKEKHQLIRQEVTGR